MIPIIIFSVVGNVSAYSLKNKPESDLISTENITTGNDVSAYATKVFEYLPAPGQFINTSIAMSEAQNNILGNNNSYMISLGGWGGYVIVGFDQPIVNNPQNPYGVDFTIDGNAFAKWSEPAAVMVMKDLNGNGIPDDGEWYELAGSEYYSSHTIKNMTMTYYNPKYDKAYTVPFSTDKDVQGAILSNRFHNQSYYPDPFDFNINIDSVSFTGTYTRYLLDKSAVGLITAVRPPLFGYTDSKPNGPSVLKPENPYNSNIGNGFDLGWAVDKNGNAVDLDTIHFVKIYSTVQEDGGWLGEMSPEIVRIGITTPDPAYVSTDFYNNYIAVAPLQVLKGTTNQYEGFLFKNGRPSKEGTLQWKSSNPQVGTIDNTGLFTALADGDTYISFSQCDTIPGDTIHIAVVELKEVIIEMEGNNASISSDTTSLIVGEAIYITAQCTDNRDGISWNGYKGNRYAYERFNWTTSNPEIGTIDNGLFKAKNVGQTKVFAQSSNRPNLADSIVIIVKEIPSFSLREDTISIKDSKRTGNYKASILFDRENNNQQTIYLKSVISDNDNHLESFISMNNLEYSFTDEVYGTEKMTLVTEFFNKEYSFDLYLESKDPSGASISEIGNNDNLVYPTLFESGFNTKLDNTDTARLEIYNLLGQRIKTIDVLDGSYVDMSNESSGQYIIRIFSKNEILTNQIIIKK